MVTFRASISKSTKSFLLFKRICQKLLLLHFALCRIQFLHFIFHFEISSGPPTPLTQCLKSTHKVSSCIAIQLSSFRKLKWDILVIFYTEKKGLSYLIACNISGLDMALCDCAFGGAWCWWWWCKWTGWCKWWSLVPFQSVMSSLLWR